MFNNQERLDAEWMLTNAIRDSLLLGSKGNANKATYRNALWVGDIVSPGLLGADSSLIRREFASNLVRQFRQMAELASTRASKVVTAISLVNKEISEIRDLLSHATRDDPDQLRLRLRHLEYAKSELEDVEETENRIIQRDAFVIDRPIPKIESTASYTTFEITRNVMLRLCGFHPDKPEHITGADLLYERHNLLCGTVRIAVVQYKVWERRELRLSDVRLNKQLAKIEAFTCKQGLCDSCERQ